MPRATIIDCDPGTDDAIALLLAMASPELDLKLITAVGGNVGLARTLANARAIASLGGTAAPVIAGADRALLHPFEPAAYVHGQNGLGGVDLPEGKPATPGHAADAIRATLRAAAPRSITLVGIGPATNLGLALATEPALADRIEEIVLMTGAWGEGNVTPIAEFNAWNDPEALQILFTIGCTITLATLDFTAQALCTPARIAAIRALGTGLPLQKACDIMASVAPTKRLGVDGHPEHDTCAIMWLVAPHLFEVRDVFIEVDCSTGPGRGQTVIDRWNRLKRPANARVMEKLDADGFFAVLGERLAWLGPE
jgi:purine nucleosidase